jgi:hypothetical protein
MKNTIRLLATFVCLVGLWGSWAQAQESPYLKAHIPFDFIAGNRTLPAGDYLIKRGLSNSPDVLLIRGKENKEAMFLLVNETQAQVTPTESQLVFDRFGDSYFLSTIWLAGEDLGCEAPMPKAEHELELSGMRHEETAVRAIPANGRTSG